MKGIKTGRKGGQLKNVNAVKHGAYSMVVDGRTRKAKQIAATELALTNALGGAEAISPQQALIVSRCAHKAMQCQIIEAQLLRSNGATAQSTKEDYLSWSRELRLDLQALGLQKRARDVTPDLKTYLQQRDAEREQS